MSARTRIGFLVAGVAVVAGAVAPPVADIVHDSFAAHMTQHLALMLVAGPLVACARPGRLRMPALLVAGANAIAVWTWHAPALYTAALEHDLLHAAEHVTFLVVSWLLWTVVLPSGAPYPPRVAVVFVTALQSSALGAILAFASVVLYPIHDPGRFGLTPLEDQQLAGAIMWIPPGLVYIGTMVALLFAWFRGMEDPLVEPGDAR